MEVIKLVKVIQLGDELKQTLKWNVPPYNLHLSFRSERGAHSSGRIIYATKPREHDETLYHHPCV